MLKNKGLIEFFKKLSNDQNFLKEFLSLPSPEEMYQCAVKNSPGEFSFSEFMDAIKLFFNLTDKGVHELSEYDTEKVSGGASHESRVISALLLVGPGVNLINSLRSYYYKNKKLNEAIKNYEENKETNQKIMQDRLSQVEEEIRLAEEKLKSM